jgi:hypothetical protein
MRPESPLSDGRRGLDFRLSMILSESRFRLFGIMLLQRDSSIQ